MPVQLKYRALEILIYLYLSPMSENKLPSSIFPFILQISSKVVNFQGPSSLDYRLSTLGLILFVSSLPTAWHSNTNMNTTFSITHSKLPHFFLSPAVPLTYKTIDLLNILAHRYSHFRKTCHASCHQNVTWPERETWNEQYWVHGQIHDFEVEHVVRPTCILSVSLQSIQAFHLHRNFRVGTAYAYEWIQSAHLEMWDVSMWILYHTTYHIINWRIMATC